LQLALVHRLLASDTLTCANMYIIHHDITSEVMVALCIVCSVEAHENKQCWMLWICSSF